MLRGVMPTPDMAMNASAGRKLSLPVEPNFLIYSHFKNVSGVPATDGGGVTISKLNILDVLIEQMNKVKSSSGVQAAPVKNGRLEAFNDAYRDQFRQAKAAGANMPYSVPPQAPAGALLLLKA